MSGGGSGSAQSAPSNTTSNNTDTVIQQAPAYDVQYISNLLGQAATSAAQPYQQFPGQQVAGFTPDQTAAFSNIENLTGNGTGGAAATQGQAANLSSLLGANSANNIASSGSPFLQAAAMYNPAAAAAPYTNAAVNTATPQGISAYMSPYTNDVVQGIQNEALNNWNQNIMPGVNNEFVQAGQGLSGRNAQVLAQNAGNFQTGLSANIANALQSGYTTAGNQAATQAGILQNAGNTAGTTAASEAANLQNIGTGLGNLAATQSGAQGAAATNLAGTANTVQNTGIAGASALQAVGQQQQALNQQNINTAISNFQNQVNWPETQESFLNSIINGLPTTGSSSTTAGQTPATTNQVGSVSPLSSLAGSLIGASSIPGAKRGGLIQNYMMGGRVKGYADGGQIPDDPSDDALNGVISRLMSGQIDNSGVLPPPVAMQPLPDIPTAGIPKVQGDQLVPPEQQHGTISDALAGGEMQVPGDPYSMSGSMKSPLSAGFPQTGLDPQKLRNYQLLSMASGFLQPARSGAQALGQAFGNYATTGMENERALAEQQQRALQFAITNSWHQGQLQNTAQRNQIYGQRVADQGDIGQQNADTAAARAAAYQQRLNQAQVDAQNNGKWELKQDAQGNWVKINSRTGDVQPVTLASQQQEKPRQAQNANAPLVGEAPLAQQSAVPTPDEIRAELLRRGAIQ
jgi:hypothetical protein